jgi:hypothetical protein
MIAPSESDDPPFESDDSPFKYDGSPFEYDDAPCKSLPHHKKMISKLKRNWETRETTETAGILRFSFPVVWKSTYLLTGGGNDPRRGRTFDLGRRQTVLEDGSCGDGRYLRR